MYSAIQFSLFHLVALQLTTSVAAINLPKVLSSRSLILETLNVKSLDSTAPTSTSREDEGSNDCVTSTVVVTETDIWTVIATEEVQTTTLIPLTLTIPNFITTFRNITTTTTVYIDEQAPWKRNSGYASFSITNQSTTESPESFISIYTSLYPSSSTTNSTTSPYISKSQTATSPPKTCTTYYTTPVTEITTVTITEATTHTAVQYLTIGVTQDTTTTVVNTDAHTVYVRRSTPEPSTTPLIAHTTIQTPEGSLNGAQGTARTTNSPNGPEATQIPVPATDESITKPPTSIVPNPSRPVVIIPGGGVIPIVSSPSGPGIILPGGGVVPIIPNPSGPGAVLPGGQVLSIVPNPSGPGVILPGNENVPIIPNPSGPGVILPGGQILSPGSATSTLGHVVSLPEQASTSRPEDVDATAPIPGQTPTAIFIDGELHAIDISSENAITISPSLTPIQELYSSLEGDEPSLKLPDGQILRPGSVVTYNSHVIKFEEDGSGISVDGTLVENALAILLGGDIVGEIITLPSGESIVLVSESDLGSVAGEIPALVLSALNSGIPTATITLGGIQTNSLSNPVLEVSPTNAVLDPSTTTGGIETSGSMPYGTNNLPAVSAPVEFMGGSERTLPEKKRFQLTIMMAILATVIAL